PAYPQASGDRRGMPVRLPRLHHRYRRNGGVRGRTAVAGTLSLAEPTNSYNANWGWLFRDNQLIQQACALSSLNGPEEAGEWTLDQIRKHQRPVADGTLLMTCTRA